MAEYLGKNEASTPEPLLVQHVADITTKADRATNGQCGSLLHS